MYRLDTGWTVRGSNSGLGEAFLHPSGPSMGPTLSPIQWVLGKAAGRGVDQPLPFCTEVKERVELHFLSVPSWQVVG